MKTVSIIVHFTKVTISLWYSLSLFLMINGFNMCYLYLLLFTTYYGFAHPPLILLLRWIHGRAFISSKDICSSRTNPRRPLSILFVEAAS